MSSATLDSSLPLDNSMGAMLLGVLVSAMLFGVCVLQTFIYFTKYKQDSMFLKTLVATLVIFNAIHLAFIINSVYYYLITNFHSPEKLEFLIWSVVIEALFNGAIAAIVQHFYAYQIWYLSKKNYFLAGFIVFLSLAAAGCGVAWVILSMEIRTYRGLLRISPLTMTINVLSAFVDILIAITLCFLLNKARTGFKRSDTMINKLMVFVVNTGLFPSFCATMTLIFLVASPHSVIYASFYFCIGRLYTNSFLATLNARKSIQNDTDCMVMASRESGLNPSGMIGESKQQKSISIRIETTTDALSYDTVTQQGKDEKLDDKSGFV